jgi:dTDP-glucose 4,6-dehydratase
MKHALVTGGLGFIGSSFVRLLTRYGIEVTVIDNYTYAADESRVHPDKPNLHIRSQDICNEEAYHLLPDTIDSIFHFAAETHVDRSIKDPDIFINTNVIGTKRVLEFAKNRNIRVVVVSTDEVYGSAPKEIHFTENDILKPSSPYSASKASSDMISMAYHTTFNTDVIITRCTNNYGEYQTIEKLVPLAIYNILYDLPIPIYGNGMQERDWIYVEDHCRGILTAFNYGNPGEIYNIGTGIETPNIVLLEILAKALDKQPKFEFIEDRKGHDIRYAIDSSKLMNLGWKPHFNLQKGMEDTAYWYKNNLTWLENNKKKNEDWLKEQYKTS